jgi:hypothetical protein
MKTWIGIVAGLTTATCCRAASEFTLLVYTDSSFEGYVGQVRFDSTDRCYPLCLDSAAVAAFVWNPKAKGTQLVAFEDGECQGSSIAGETKAGSDVSAIASSHKVRSFILSTTQSHEPTRGIVHSCHEQSDVVYKAYNDTAAWM